MNLERSIHTWDTLARADAMHAILTHDTKKDRQWNEVEFFKTGLVEIHDVLSELQRLQVSVQHKKALDFGCGIGRLSRALANHFDQVVGVDISDEMIRLAKLYNPSARFIFLVNQAKNLDILSPNTFDFIYSNIVLQHVSPGISKMYLKSFAQLLKPTGILVFQLPEHPRKFSRRLADLCRYVAPSALTKLVDNHNYKGLPRMDMFGISRKTITSLLSENNMDVLAVVEDSDCGPDWTGFRYIARKK